MLIYKKEERACTMNILVVDDEKNIAYAIAQILEEQKWQVTMAYYAPCYDWFCGCTENACQ